MFSFLNRSSSKTDVSQSSNNTTNAVQLQTEDVLAETLTCPITQQVMMTPVITPEGHTYEKNAILEWLKHNSSDPQTRNPLNASMLKPNTNLQYLCDQYHQGKFNINSKQKSPVKISLNNIEITHNCFTNNEKNQLMLSFNINESTFPKEIEHLSQDVIIVIDRSGSMGTSVGTKNANGETIEDGFSIQDIVNHAAKVVAKTLDNNSRLGIIVFDNEIETIFDLKLMSEMNKSLALSSIEQIKPRGQTNIYGAIERAINILDERDDKSNNGAILVFTDGAPNISPARGEVETLKKLRVKKNFTAPIYTFGFGYSLQRELLYDIAKCANGGNGHIPDGGMIATVFCNFIATILTTIAINLQLHILTPNVSLMGDYISNKNPENNSVIYDLGTIQYQQTRDIVFNKNNEDKIEYFFTYKIGGNSYKSETYIVNNIETISTSTNFDEQYLRCKYVENIRCIINYCKCNDFTSSKKLIDEMETMLKSYSTTPLITGMLNNLVGNEGSEGQITLASSKEFFKRWGEFYLDQLSRACLLQIKPNFKDNACLFGGKVFNNIVDKSSDIFDTLPPPKPSNSRTSYSNNSVYSSGYSSVTPSLSVYNDPNGGCFTGNCKIKMADSTYKYVKDIKKGDKVLSVNSINYKESDFVEAYVICVVKTIYKQGVPLVNIKNYTENGIYITPWHPINFNNKWEYPNNINKSEISTFTELYTFVLNNHHIVIIENIPCICLGHNYTSNPVLDHPYFGSHQIINDLQKLDNWSNGEVIVDSNKYIRDNESGLICRMNI